MNYITQEQFAAAQELVDKVSRQLSRFITYLETHPRAASIREEALDYSTDI